MAQDGDLQEAAQRLLARGRRRDLVAQSRPQLVFGQRYAALEWRGDGRTPQFHVVHGRMLLAAIRLLAKSITGSHFGEYPMKFSLGNLWCRRFNSAKLEKSAGRHAMIRQSSHPSRRALIQTAGLALGAGAL